MITVTQQAVKQLQALLGSDTGSSAGPGRGLRLSVERGGCAGMSYTMKVGAPVPDDIDVARDGVHIFIDPESADILKGCEVDYVDELSDAGFRINNPNAARSCGCGTSFEPATQSKTENGA